MPSVRDAFFNRICELVQVNENIIVVTPDLGAPSLDDFRKNHPDNYISVGIAEQNMISVAAGLALAGKKVIAYGLNPFPVTRAYDQVRSLLAELNIPVTLCALNAGLCSAECGYTHMPIEDVGMMRMLSNIQTFNPSDETMSEMLADDVLNTTNARFIRFDKAINKKIYKNEEVDIKKGFISYGEECGLCIVTYGCFVPFARDLVDRYKSIGRNLQVIDLFSLSADRQALFMKLQSCKKILSLEENVLPGGMGSYLLELLSDFHLLIPVERLGLHFPEGYYNVFTSREYIRLDQGIDEDDVVKRVEKIMKEI